MRRNEQLHAAAWMKLRKKPHTKNSTYGMIPFIQISKEAKPICDVGSQDDGFFLWAILRLVWHWFQECDHSMKIHQAKHLGFVLSFV